MRSKLKSRSSAKRLIVAILALVFVFEAHQGEFATANTPGNGRATGTPLSRVRRTALSAEERASCRPSQGLAGPRKRPDEQDQGSSSLLEHETKANASSAQPSRPAASTKVDTSERLRQLRQLLISNNYDAYLVTPNDEHGSEYVSDFDRRLRFISGFSGSNGFALITLDRAVLFTDGRYALQAELDLDCNWALVVADQPLLEVPVWTRSHLGRRASLRLATDARLMSLQVYDQLERELKRQYGTFEFALISLDLIDIVWNNFSEQQQFTREKPLAPLTIHPMEFAGQVGWQDKVLRVAELMARSRARYYVISKLDDIAWLLNLRGSDVPMAPLFKAYLLISRQPFVAANNLQTTASTSTTSQVPSSSPSQTLSLEQLLAAANSMNQQQVASAMAASDQLTLQSPQVVQVPTSQLIKLTLYVDLRKITPPIREHLRLYAQQSGGGNTNSSGEHFTSGDSRIQLELKDYDVFIMDFGERFRPQTTQSGQPQLFSNARFNEDEQQQQQPGRLLLDAMANVAIHVLAKHYDDRLILVEPLCQRLKSVKNELEVAGMRQAHWRDSLAIAMLLGQLEHDIANGARCDLWTELSAARELEFYRSLMDFNRGQSFETISAYGSNAAIIHYQPDPKVAPSRQVRLCNQSTYLLDSGGQYLDGTTDITRTVHFGAPSSFQRETYTRVLMGAIDMMSLVFEKPREQATFRLNDLIARRHLFELGLDYEHGTGHGIGLYSLVHEAPALIVPYNQEQPAAKQQTSSSSSSSSKLTQTAMVQNELLSIRENMFTSVEPGYYKPGEFGIRLENIVVTQRQQPSLQASANGNQTANGTQQREWLRFEPISLVPFEPKLIKLELMSNKQKAWLNSYNLLVRLRMTQQINYYLTKVRQSQQRVHVRGTTSGSRLYRQLQERQQANLQTSGTTASASNGSLDSSRELLEASRRNFMRIEPDKFQQLLEQAHRWIMSKTELISLDVPARSSSLAGGGLNSSSLSGRGANESQQASNTSQRAANQDEWSVLGANPQGQRLMLAYMAAPPFSDPDAAQALANSLAGRSGSQTGATEATDTNEQLVNKSQPAKASSTMGQRCHGIDCDLLLLEALNSHQRLMAAARGKAQATSASGLEEPQLGNELVLSGDSAQDQRTGQQMLMDMFQMNPVSSAMDSGSLIWSAVTNMWPILGLALILVLQLAVIVYVCAGGGRHHSDHRQPTGQPNSATGSFSSARRRSLETGVWLPTSNCPSQQQQQRRVSASRQGSTTPPVLGLQLLESQPAATQADSHEDQLTASGQNI